MLVDTIGAGTEHDDGVTARLAAAIDELAAIDPDTLSDGELAETVVDVHGLEARLAAVRTRLIACSSPGACTWTTGHARRGRGWHTTPGNR